MLATSRSGDRLILRPPKRAIGGPVETDEHEILAGVQHAVQPQIVVDAGAQASRCGVPRSGERERECPPGASNTFCASALHRSRQRLQPLPQELKSFGRLAHHAVKDRMAIMVRERLRRELPDPRYPNSAPGADPPLAGRADEPSRDNCRSIHARAPESPLCEGRTDDGCRRDRRSRSPCAPAPLRKTGSANPACSSKRRPADPARRHAGRRW